MQILTMIPMPLVYAGLAGVLLALIVATAQNKWQWRVFALLTLRLAIGWHFTFEGLHKLNSTAVGETATSKPFSSAPYFTNGDGPFAELARKQFIADPEHVYAERIVKPKELSTAEFLKLDEAQRAELCPTAVATLFTSGTTEAAQTAQANYAGWLYGAIRRDTKFKDMANEVPTSVEQWTDYIALLEKELASRLNRQHYDLGRGDGLEVKRTAAVRADLNALKADFAKATEDYIAELRKDADIAPPKAQPKLIDTMDTAARWGITAIGLGLLMGLFTRLWCLAGIGFLVMTYLSSPPFPWLPPGPPSEGNPLFINKNLIEAIGLFVVLCHPTGRWLGLDALLDYIWHGKNKNLPM